MYFNDPFKIYSGTTDGTYDDYSYSGRRVTSIGYEKPHFSSYDSDPYGKATKTTKKVDRKANKEKKKVTTPPTPKFKNNTKVHVTSPIAINGESEFNGLIIETVFPHTKTNHTDDIAYYVRNDDDYKMYMVKENRLSTYLINTSAPSTPDIKDSVETISSVTVDDTTSKVEVKSIKVCDSGDSDITIAEVDRVKDRIDNLEQMLNDEIGKRKSEKKKLKKLLKVGLAIGFGI